MSVWPEHDTPWCHLPGCKKAANQYFEFYFCPEHARMFKTDDNIVDLQNIDTRVLPKVTMWHYSCAYDCPICNP